MGVRWVDCEESGQLFYFTLVPFSPDTIQPYKIPDDI